MKTPLLRPDKALCPLSALILSLPALEATAQEVGDKGPPDFVIMLWYAGLTCAAISILALVVYTVMRKRTSQVSAPQEETEAPEEDDPVPGIMMHQTQTVPIEPRYGAENIPRAAKKPSPAPATSFNRNRPDTIGALIDEVDGIEPDDVVMPRAAMFRDAGAIKKLQTEGWSEYQIARRFGWGLGEVQLALHLAQKNAFASIQQGAHDEYLRYQQHNA